MNSTDARLVALATTLSDCSRADTESRRAYERAVEMFGDRGREERAAFAHRVSTGLAVNKARKAIERFALENY